SAVKFFECVLLPDITFFHSIELCPRSVASYGISGISSVMDASSSIPVFEVSCVYLCDVCIFYVMSASYFSSGASLILVEVLVLLLSLLHSAASGTGTQFDEDARALEDAKGFQLVWFEWRFSSLKFSSMLTGVYEYAWSFILVRRIIVESSLSL
nr:hypothetical protein [Tanacetum cinerariifolium]